MSGGSFEYLCHKDAGELLQDTGQLERMVAELASLGYAEDAAREADELLCIIRQSEVRINTRLERLSWIFRQVEWWHSGDTGEDGVKKALADYRGELENPPHPEATLGEKGGEDD